MLYTIEYWSWQYLVKAKLPYPTPQMKEVAQGIYAMLDAYERQCRQVEESKESFKGPHWAGIQQVKEVTLLFPLHTC